MATVVEQRKESPVQPTQWADAQDHVEKDKSRRRECPDEHDFIGDEREENFAENTK
jgi:hypothetical protein